MRDSDLTEYLGGIEIDWTRFEAAAAQSRDCLGILTSDRAALTALVERAVRDPALRVKCESHQLLDYLVLYDCVERGVRVRLHLSTTEHLQRPHDHRFDFSSMILCGSYEHCIVNCKVNPYEIRDEAGARPYQDRHNPDPLIRLKNADFPVANVRNERAGDIFSLHHSVAHTVLTAANTVSLVLRGGPRRNRSFIFDRTQERLWWRFGQENESRERRAQKIMPAEQLTGIVQRLRALRVLN